MKKLVQERFKGHEKFAEDSLRGSKFSQNKIKFMNFFTKKMRGSKEMGSREKNDSGGYPLNKCPAPYSCRFDPNPTMEQLCFRKVTTHLELI